MLLKDLAETKARAFQDKRSYVRNDKSEVLFGRDWTARKRELHERSNGKCERAIVLRKPHAALCSGRAEEPHHVVPRSKGRDDRLANLVGLSHACHFAEDPRKIGGRP